MIAALVLQVALQAGPVTAPAAPRPPAPAAMIAAPGARAAPQGWGGMTPPAATAERVTFAEAMRRAARQATATVVSAGEIRRAEALLGEVRAAALPFVGANGQWTHLDGPRGTFTPQDAVGGNVTATVPVVAPSRWAAWSHASEQVEVARATDAEVRRTTVVGAARAYLAILSQKRFIDVSRSARDIARARFEFAHARRQGGIGNAVDEARAQQQLAQAEANLASGEVNLARAQEALGVLTGADAPVDAADEPGFEPRAVAQPIQAAQDDRADVRASRARLAAAEHVARDSWLDWLPTLTFNAQVFDNPVGAGVINPNDGWQVQFVLALPLFEGGLRVSQQHERDTLAEEARATLNGVLRQARSDVRVAFAEVARQEDALASARLAASSARSVLDLTVEAYRAGATNDLDVSTAQQQSRDADLVAVIAEDNVRQARLDLLSALGQFP